MMKTVSHDFRSGGSGPRKLFDSPTLERLTRTHIAVPVTIFLVYSFSLLYWAIANTSLSAVVTLILFLTGIFIFSWVEYNVHRYIFHIPAITEFTRRFQYIIHGVHHEFPKDKDRLAMPPLLSVTVATVLLLCCRVVMGDWAFAFMPGFLVGYAAYLSIHYIVHAYPPPKGWYRMLWKNHAIHHYKDGEVVFGVSSPLWDFVYGTMPGKSNRKIR